jgi:hypothetical protein
MKMVISPYRNIIFWLKALVCSSFFILGLSALTAPDGFGPAIVMFAIAYGLTILLMRDRVFTFEPQSLRISAALDFYPFNRIFKSYTYQLNEIDYISLTFSEEFRYWGILFDLELIKKNLTAEDLEKDIEHLQKIFAQQSKIYFLAFVSKSKVDLWADKIEEFGIRTIRKK